MTGLDLSLTEFGVSTANSTTVQNAATYLEDTMRMVFGTANATTFMMWGFWAERRLGPGSAGRAQGRELESHRARTRLRRA